MFILVNPDTNVLIKIAEECKPIINRKGSNIECEDEKATAYLLDDGLIYPKKLPSQMYEVDNIPEEVIPYKYLYTVENGFTINENYSQPIDIDKNIENIENELFNIRSNIIDLDDVNVKTNKSKTLDVYLYLGNNGYFINNEGNANLNEVRIQSILNLGASGSKYYLDNNGNANLNTLIINNATFKGNVYFANSTTYYINSNGDAKFSSITTNSNLSVGGTSSFAGNSTFKSNVYFANGTKYYINNVGNAKFASIVSASSISTTTSLNVGTTSSFTGNATFKSNVYFANGTKYYVYNNGNAKFASIASASSISVGTNATVLGDIILKGHIYMENSTCIYGKDTKGKYLSLINPQSEYNNVALGYDLQYQGDPCSLNLYGGMNGVQVLSELHIRKGGYLSGVLYCSNDVEYWINANGNAVLHVVNIEGTLRINASSKLNDQLTLGSKKSSHTGKEYYINAYGNGSFNGVWIDTLAYYKGGSASSRRYKENIEYRDTNYWHDKLMQLKPCTFNYKNYPNDTHLGFIAEDVVDIIPELVELDEKGNCNLIRIQEIISMLVSEVQRLNSYIK